MKYIYKSINEFFDATRNKFFDLEDHANELQKEIDIQEDIAKKLRHDMANNYFENQEQVKELQDKIDAQRAVVKNLTDELESLKQECNHTDQDGKSAITWKGEHGPGHITYTCGVCGTWGSRNWARKFIEGL